MTMSGSSYAPDTSPGTNIKVSARQGAKDPGLKADEFETLSYIA